MPPSTAFVFWLAVRFATCRTQPKSTPSDKLCFSPMPLQAIQVMRHYFMCHTQRTNGPGHAPQATRQLAHAICHGPYAHRPYATGHMPYAICHMPNSCGAVGPASFYRAAFDVRRQYIDRRQHARTAVWPSGMDDGRARGTVTPSWYVGCTERLRSVPLHL